eukprot:735828-Prymnesium_polylepis.1
MSITSDELNFLVYRYLHESGAQRTRRALVVRARTACGSPDVVRRFSHRASARLSASRRSSALCSPRA